jgi:hypothetical protein
MLASIQRLPLAVHRKDWLRAGELAYTAFESGLAGPADEGIVVFAMRRHARLTRDYQRAIEATEDWSGVTWNDEGMPLLPQRQDIKTSAIGLADLLIASGQVKRAERLLQAIITQLEDELRAGIRNEIWTFSSMSIALALAGNKSRALDWLERGVAAGVLRGPREDPALDSLRGEPRFAVVMRDRYRRMAAERSEVEAMRAAGELPSR